MGNYISISKKVRVFQLQSKYEVSQNATDFEQNDRRFQVITEDLQKNHAEKNCDENKIIPGTVL
jgi:hypothetical protein